MDDKKLSALRSRFVDKPTPELRRIINNADTGDWTEEAIAAAREILASRPVEAEDGTEEIGRRTALCSSCGERVPTYKRKLIVDMCPNCVAALERAALSDVLCPHCGAKMLHGHIWVLGGEWPASMEGLEWQTGRSLVKGVLGRKDGLRLCPSELVMKALRCPACSALLTRFESA